MPRKPRTISSTGIYHIILRSINQHVIFEEDSDYQKFLYLLSDCKNKYDIDVYAYCLMDNHIHLLLNLPTEILPSFFQSLESQFARWYNNKYSRVGYLFQDRYHSVAIESRANYLSVLSYIHNNPVKANICRFPSEYQWSSYNAFYGKKNPLINLSFSYEMAGSKDSLLKYFAYDPDMDTEYYTLAEIKPTTHFYTDETALKIFKDISGLSTTSEAACLRRADRNNLIRSLRQTGLTVKQIARLMDVSMTTVKRYI